MRALISGSQEAYGPLAFCVATLNFLVQRSVPARVEPRDRDLR